MTNREIIVVGGGMVGALSALLLANKGETIHLIEKFPLPSPLGNDSFDLRVSAFSEQSKCLLEEAGVWNDIPKNRLCAYQELHTWEQGSKKLIFSSDNIGSEQLGYIAENRWIQAVLWQKLKQLPNVYLYEKTEVLNIYQKDIDQKNNGQRNIKQTKKESEKSVAVTLSNQSVIQGDLLLACDGANSKVRNQLQLPVTSWDYRQHCLLINITTDCAQHNITWQEFRETGPCAFLPLAGNNASLVWYHNPQKIKHLQNMSNQQLKEAILAEFPKLDFDFEVHCKASFPLKRRHAKHYYQGKVVLLGDAAHTINPLAGQGVNLGFKDAECLINLLTQCSDLPLTEILKRYQCQRRPANLLMQGGMDVFYKISKSDSTVIRFLRKGFLGLAQESGGIKSRVMRYAMGIN